MTDELSQTRLRVLALQKVLEDNGVVDSAAVDAAMRAIDDTAIRRPFPRPDGGA